VLVGREEDLYASRVAVRDVNWLAEPPEGPVRVAAKLRYRHAESPALLVPTGPDTVLLEFDEPQRAPAPGQGAVFYQGERVLGGGVVKG